MATQIVFTTDEALKRDTLHKLRQEGNTLKALLQYSMKAYLSGKISLGIITEDDHRNATLESDYQEKIKDFQEDKNIVAWDDLVAKYS